MEGRYPDPELKVRFVIEDGDFLAVYAQLLESKSDPSRGGLRQVHLFRFKDDKIAEFCDDTQTIRPDMPNPANAF